MSEPSGRMATAEEKQVLQNIERINAPWLARFEAQADYGEDVHLVAAPDGPLVKFADYDAAVKAAVLAERERCAKVCETLDHGAFGSNAFLSGVQLGSIGCANAIRKGETP